MHDYHLFSKALSHSNIYNGWDRPLLFAPKETSLYYVRVVGRMYIREHKLSPSHITYTFQAFCNGEALYLSKSPNISSPMSDPAIRTTRHSWPAP